MMSKFGIGRAHTAIAPSGNDDGMVNVTYHSTHVVSYSGDAIILRSGGYQTVTTKRRMNEASKTLDLGYTVVQHDGDWFVVWDGQIYTYRDGMRFDRKTRSIFYDRFDGPVVAVTEKMRSKIAI